MQMFTHHQHENMDKPRAGSTQGWVMDMGWRYDLMVWFLDIFLMRGQLGKLPQRVADLAQLQSGEAVLGVGSGTGALAIEACTRVGVTGRVCGINPSPRQIARARSKVERAGLPVDFQVGVIEQLAFPDRSFDVLLSTLMLHHLTDDLKRLGFAEIACVLKPGGHLVMVDFNRPEAGQGKPPQFGAGTLGLQDMPALLTAAGFSQMESGKITFPLYRNSMPPS